MDDAEGTTTHGLRDSHFLLPNSYHTARNL